MSKVNSYLAPKRQATPEYNIHRVRTLTSLYERRKTPYSTVGALILRENEGRKGNQGDADHDLQLRSGNGL